MTKQKNVKYRKSSLLQINFNFDLVVPEATNAGTTVVLKIPAGKSQMTIWDIYDDASGIAFKTSIKTY